ncbi:hypothetical protein [uncultured Methanobrevibacter sp.]|uniref:hypothetical protein n=1 Tax=uncultured Methanobrevibacter sp. TaxID=253161 RepID=UPI0025F29CD3|nr:hypothetical protein [uncultured Methanobrevibacter sp.]
MKDNNIKELIHSIQHLNNALDAAWAAEQNFDNINKASIFNPYIGKKLKIEFKAGSNNSIHSVSGTVEYAGGEEIVLKHITWNSTPPEFEQGKKVQIEYKKINNIEII